jgi:hypothetical protein
MEPEGSLLHSQEPATCLYPVALSATSSSKLCTKLTLHCNHRSGHLKMEHTGSLLLLRRHLGNWPCGPLAFTSTLILALLDRLVCGRAGLAHKHSGLIQAHCAPRRFLVASFHLQWAPMLLECRDTSRSACTPTRSLEPFC